MRPFTVEPGSRNDYTERDGEKTIRSADENQRRKGSIYKKEYANEEKSTYAYW